MAGRPFTPEALDFLEELDSLEVGNSFQWDAPTRKIYQWIYRNGKKSRKYEIHTIGGKKFVFRTK